MAGAGYKDFTAGDVFTADQVDQYLMEQSTMVFATAAARDAALTTVKAEGMMAYLSDAPNRLTYYDGSAWVNVWSDWAAFTPAWTNLTVGAGTNTGEYCYTPGGMWVRGQWQFGAGAAVGTSPVMTLPNSETLRDAVTQPMGRTQLLDNTGSQYLADIWYASSTTVGFGVVTLGGTYAYWSAITASVPMTWATDDEIVFQFFVPL